MSITVTLPMPDRRLSPNHRNRKCWQMKARVAKDARIAGGDAGFIALMGRDKPQWIEATVSVRVIKCNARYRMDDQNLIASLKAYIDGCVDAGIMADDKGLRWGNVEWIVDRTITKQQERVELTFDAFPAE